MSIDKNDIASVKGRGFLQNRGTDRFSGRVVSVGGVYSPSELMAIAECAEKYGNGKIAFTSRMSAEITGIPFEKITEAEEFMKSRGLSFGGTGAKIRPITACKGTTCVYGNIDTHETAAILHQKFYVDMAGVKLPHKFKIGVGGCPNSCMKPSLNDVGIEGCKIFSFDSDKCRGCKICQVAASCPSRAVTIADGKASVNSDLCHSCGVCIGKCPFGAFPAEADSACKIYVGGTWGKTRRDGTLLKGTYPLENIAKIIEKIILWYKGNGYAKERFGQTLDRLGVERLESAIASNDLINRKNSIAAAPINERQ